MHILFVDESGPGQTLRQQIKSAFRTSPNGKIDGYGLVKFPKGW